MFDNLIFCTLRIFSDNFRTLFLDFVINSSTVFCYYFYTTLLIFLILFSIKSETVFRGFIMSSSFKILLFSYLNKLKLQYTYFPLILALNLLIYDSSFFFSIDCVFFFIQYIKKLVYKKLIYIFKATKQKKNYYKKTKKTI